MTISEFQDFCGAVYAYFGLTEKAKQIEEWFPLLEDIPGEPLNWIKRKMFAECDSLPRNMPKYVRGRWADWCTAHPRRVAWAAGQVTCQAPGCEDGWIFIRREGQNAVAMCDRCAVSRKLTTAGSPLLDNLASLEQKGWILRGLYAAPAEPSTPRTPLFAGGGRQTGLAAASTADEIF